MINIHVFNPYNTIGGGSISQIGLNKVISSANLFEKVYTYDLNTRLKKIKIILNVISIVNSNNDYILIQGLFDIEYILFDLFLLNKKKLIIIPRGAFVPSNMFHSVVKKTFLKKLLWKIFIKNRLNLCGLWIPTSNLERLRLLEVGANINNSIIIPDYFKGEERFLNDISNTVDLKVESQKYLLYVGRISREKNLFFLIDVYLEIVKKYNDYNLIIVGPIDDFDLYKRIIKKIQKYKIQDKVIIHSNCSKSQLISYYNNCSTVLLPSHIESLGLIVLEAIYFNKYIFISNNVPFDLNDTNLGETLKLDVNLWVNQIDAYLSNEKKSSKSITRENILNQYNFNVVSDLWNFNLLKLVQKYTIDK